MSGSNLCIRFETPDLYKPIMVDNVGNGLDRSVSPLQPIIMIAWIWSGIITYLSILL